MMPNDFVYRNCFKIGINIGLSDRDSGEIAAESLRMFKRGKLKKSTDVFKWAESESKRKRRAAR